MPSSSEHDSATSLPKIPYRVRTAELPPSALEHRVHSVMKTNHRYQVSLGDRTALTKTGVHLCRLPAGATSTTLHWHSHEDEWFYILKASEDAVLLVWEPSAPTCGESGEAVVPRVESLKEGDFLGFKGGVERAHAFRAGESQEVVYLMGGSREPLDISHYPEVGKRRVIDQTEGGVSWTVDDSSIQG